MITKLFQTSIHGFASLKRKISLRNSVDWSNIIVHFMQSLHGYKRFWFYILALKQKTIHNNLYFKNYGCTQLICMPILIIIRIPWKLLLLKKPQFINYFSSQNPSQHQYLHHGAKLQVVRVCGFKVIRVKSKLLIGLFHFSDCKQDNNLDVQRELCMCEYTSKVHI